MENYSEYIGMTDYQTLKAFSDKYFSEGNSTENGIVAYAIKKYLEDGSISMEDHEAEIKEYKEEYADMQNEIDEAQTESADLECCLDDLKRMTIEFLNDMIKAFKEKADEVDNL